MSTKKTKKFFFADLSVVWNVLIALVVLLLIVKVIGGFVRVKDNSMAPELAEGETVVVSKLLLKLEKPARYDVIVYEDAEGTKRFGRIIGMPGDVISLSESNIISINGIASHDIHTAYLVGQAEYPLKVPKNSYFVLCDDPFVGMDSRYTELGCIGRDQIMGKAIFVIYPFKAWRTVKYR